MNATPSPDDLFAEYLRRGEPARFAELHDLLRDELLRTAERLAPSRGAAEDLVQATFLGALESAGRFERGRKVVPWLVGILQNQARMMRWRAARTPDPQRVAWPAPRDPAELAADRGLDVGLAGAFARLGPTYAPVMVLHLRDEMSAQDIGKRLDRPAGTVRTQVVRGTAMLRSLLPAGIASLLLVRVTPGLDAAGVRDLLLEHAARGRIATTSWLASKAWLATAAGLVVAALTWLAFALNTSGTDPVAAPGTVREAARAGEGTPDGPLATSSAPEANTSLDRTAAVPPATAGLTVLVAFVDEPLQHVPVLLMGFADPRFRRAVAVTDAAGKASFPELAPGQWAVLLQGARMPRLAALVALQPGERKEHRVELGDPLTFEGRVVDERGTPLAGADVWLCDGDYQHSSGFGARRVLATDAGGTFTLTTGGRQKLSHVQVTAPGHRASALHRLPQQRGEQHTFVLAPDGDAVHGIVVDERGAPLASVFVRAVHAGKRSNHVITRSDGTTTTPPDTIGAVREVTTGEDGRFRIDGFDRGRPVALTAWGTDWARTDGTVVPDGASLTATMKRGATLHGRVVDQRGKPVAEATVAVEPEARDDPMRSRVHTDADGRYTLAGVTPVEAVDVTVTSRPDPRGRGGAGDATTTLRLEPERTVEWNATLAPGPSFRGTLAMSDGTPFDGWTLQLLAIDDVDGTNHFPVRLGKGSEFEVKNVPRARYWLQLSHDDCVALQYVVSWPLAERYDIVVPAGVARRSVASFAAFRDRERATGTLEIHGVDASKNVSVYLFERSTAWTWVSANETWDDARSCRTIALAPGRYDVAVFSTQWSPDALATADHVLDVSVAAEQTTAVRVSLQPGVRRCFRIEEPSPHLGADGGFGEVHDASGRLISRWRIPRWHEPAPGKFEASVALAPGRYRIEVETDLGHRGALDFTVDSLTPFPDVVPLPVR